MIIATGKTQDCCQAASCRSRRKEFESPSWSCTSSRNARRAGSVPLLRVVRVLPSRFDCAGFSLMPPLFVSRVDQSGGLRPFMTSKIWISSLIACTTPLKAALLAQDNAPRTQLVIPTLLVLPQDAGSITMPVTPG
jgi:hypothetical protein